MSGLSKLFRVVGAVAVAWHVGAAGTAAPDRFGRRRRDADGPPPRWPDIPVAFRAVAGTRWCVRRFNAGPDVSNWVTAGNAMNTCPAKRSVGGRPGGRRVQPLHQLGAQRLKRGDLPGRRTAELAGRQQGCGPGSRSSAPRRAAPGADDGHLPPGPRTATPVRCCRLNSTRRTPRPTA